MIKYVIYIVKTHLLPIYMYGIGIGLCHTNHMYVCCRDDDMIGAHVCVHACMHA